MYNGPDICCVWFLIVLFFQVALLFSKCVTLNVADGFVVKQVPSIGAKNGKTHWFDKLAKIYILSIKGGKISTKSFPLPSKAYEHYVKTGKVDSLGFAESGDSTRRVNQNVNVFSL